jgi:hypothetical protein
MKLLGVKTFRASFLLAGLMTASVYLYSETDKTIFVEDTPATPGEISSVKHEQKSGGNRGGELVCQDYNRDRIITFDECTFTEN